MTIAAPIAAAPGVDPFHALLGHLSGRLDDATVASARALLAEGWIPEVAFAVVEGMLDLDAGATSSERALLGAALAEDEHGRDLLAAVRAEGKQPDPPACRAPYERGGDPAADAVDDALAVELQHVVGARAAWRAVRCASESGRLAERSVWLVEVAADSAGGLAMLSGRLQRVLTEAGIGDPAFDLVAAGAPLSPFAARVRTVGRRFWTSSRPRVARVYDGLDRDGAPRFDEAHPLLTGARRDRVLLRLKTGSVVLRGAAPLLDVLDPEGAGIDNVFRTDGVWVWHEAVAHHLSSQALAPEPDLLGHLEAAPPTVLASEAWVLETALDALRAHSAAGRP